MHPEVTLKLKLVLQVVLIMTAQVITRHRKTLRPHVMVCMLLPQRQSLLQVQSLRGHLGSETVALTVLRRENILVKFLPTINQTHDIWQ